MVQYFVQLCCGYLIPHKCNNTISATTFLFTPRGLDTKSFFSGLMIFHAAEFFFMPMIFMPFSYSVSELICHLNDIDSDLVVDLTVLPLSKSTYPLLEFWISRIDFLSHRFVT